MSVWLTIPSARPHEEAEKVLKLWLERGYKVSVWRDYGAPPLFGKAVRTSGAMAYPGYASAVNQLIGWAMIEDPGAEWFVVAGDDIEPDLNHSAEEIAAQCARHFGEQQGSHRNEPDSRPGFGTAIVPYSTFGVMQPTGDRWGDSGSSRARYGEGRGAYADRVCGSAWIGREFAQRMYQGNGPLFPGYKHMFVDEELQEVAIKMGVLWQRRDLIQLHQHWGRTHDGSPIVEAKIPEHLQKWNSKEHWNESKKLFEERKRAGFPGHEPK